MYLCNSGTLKVIPSYGLVSGGMKSVPYGMMWGSVWVGCLVACPGFIAILVLVFILWRGSGSIGTVVVGCCVPSFPLWWYRCLFQPRKLRRGGVGVTCGISVLKMDTNWLSATVWFYHKWVIGLGGAGFWSTYVSSDVKCANESADDRIGSCFCAGKSSVMSDTGSKAILGM